MNREDYSGKCHEHRSHAELTEFAQISLSDWMTRGGDARIVLDPKTGLNQYFCAPTPRDVLAFASSTANDISPEAHAYLQGRFPHGVDELETGNGYTAMLDDLRAEIRAIYALEPETDIFFAPSGTDLEYVALLSVAGRRANGIVNYLLGADEVGSGCIHSAAGHYFASQTALGTPVSPAKPVEGLPPIEMRDLPVRCKGGDAIPSAFLIDQMERSIADTLSRKRFPLVHIVHGSKTGLVLPRLEDVEALRARFGNDAAFVVDACQARITIEAIHEYLTRGIIVFITGSKFMGGPPFSAFALLPKGMAANAAPLPAGIATIFRRAEIPEGWPGRDICDDSGNAGLALRLSASIFELRRFQALGIDRITRVVSAFTRATDLLARTLNVRKVASAPAADGEDPCEHPIEMLTLVTLDLCHGVDGGERSTMSFDDSVAIHRALVRDGIRLGQPVRCVRLANGNWGGTMRIGLSMPQVTRLDALDDGALEDWMTDAMDRIVSSLRPLLTG